MPDTYRNFATLARKERSGIDYDVLVRRARTEIQFGARPCGHLRVQKNWIARSKSGLMC
jgi:hypothetical protein